ncbi:MAG: hypothetical protein ACOVSW_18605 [Candidatus Kapaibacteriota bacterium]
MESSTDAIPNPLAQTERGRIIRHSARALSGADFSTRLKHAKPLHHAVFTALVALIFSGLYFGITPALIEKAALTTLTPSEIVVVNFNGVFASPTSEGAKFAGQEPTRAWTSGEFVLDFTTTARNREQHGYAKASDEWLIKTPFMGDEAVVITPSIALSVPLLGIALFTAFLLTFLLPTSIGLFAALAERTYAESRIKLLFQTGFSENVVNFLLLSDAEVAILSQESPELVNAHLHTLWEATRTDNERQTALTSYAQESLFDAASVTNGHHAFVRNTLVSRMKEAFSPAIVHTIHTLQLARLWRENRLHLAYGVRLYMSELFAPNYGNVVQGFAYAGAGLMIVVIGLRGLRFIPASHPSLIVATIALECALLLALGLTLIFQREEVGSAESLKRIENNTQNVALVMSSVDNQSFQRAMQEAIRDRIERPDMEKRIAESLTETFVESLRAGKSRTAKAHA